MLSNPKPSFNSLLVLNCSIHGGRAVGQTPSQFIGHRTLAAGSDAIPTIELWRGATNTLVADSRLSRCAASSRRKLWSRKRDDTNGPAHAARLATACDLVECGM